MQHQLIIITLAAAGMLAAQDPPSRAGRLSYVSGAVSFEPDGVSDWAAATLNRPLTMGDQLYTDSGARAEVQVPGAAFRLSDRTAFEFLNLDDRTVQVRLSEGTLDVRVRRLDGALEIDTPNVAFTANGPGEYRLDTNADGSQTLVTARDGSGQVTATGGSFTLSAGQQAVVAGQDQAAQYKVNPAPGYDAFDHWVMSRNTSEDRYARSGYVSPEMVGYGDLGEYGTWRSTPDYGDVWVPNGVAAGWAPYQDGYWAWVDPWGWTWVDDAPWGFAPFHYGRWAYLNGYWGWCPGPIDADPVYAPALVAWLGFGSGFGGGPAVGWFPLGPRDVYVPAFTASAGFVDRLNVTNARAINAGMVNEVYGRYLRNRSIPVSSYMNRSVPGAVVAVPESALASARPVQQVAMKVRPNQIAGIRSVDPAPRVAPQLAGVLGHAPGRNVPRPAAAVLNRSVVARNTPPPAAAPFQQRQALLARNPGRPLAAAQMHQLESAGGAVHSRPPVNVIRQTRTITPQVAHAGTPNAPRTQRSFEPPIAHEPAQSHATQPQVSRTQPPRSFEPPAAQSHATQPQVSRTQPPRSFEPPAAQSHAAHPQVSRTQPPRGFEPPAAQAHAAHPQAARTEPRHAPARRPSEPPVQHARVRPPAVSRPAPVPQPRETRHTQAPPEHHPMAAAQMARQSPAPRPEPHVQAPPPRRAEPAPHVEPRPAPPPERKPEKR